MSAAPERLSRIIDLDAERRRRAAPAAHGLEAVLDGRRLGVAFQPIAMRVVDNGELRWRMDGVEALVRAQAPARPILRPQRLLPIIERAGLMPALFLYVLTESLAASREWADAGLEVELAVNMHSGAVLDDSLPELVAGLLEVNGLSPARLTLELTESSPIRNLQQAARNLARIRQAGIRVALDDFGSGFSTTTRLDSLECDEIKIDKSLVRELEQGEEPRRVIEGLVRLAHARGLVVCAEGVETEQSLTLLGALGADRVQGYLIGRPRSGRELPGTMDRWARRPAVAMSSEDPQLCLPGLAPGGRAGLQRS
jgi:EAL domain-containing protein (putative c-di-GMP-specific phosphodiesterase class I)